MLTVYPAGEEAEQEVKYRHHRTERDGAYKQKIKQSCNIKFWQQCHEQTTAYNTFIHLIADCQSNPFSGSKGLV